MIKEYSRIRLITNNYVDDGVDEGATGVVLECYSTGDFEVQFEDEDGNPTNKFFAVHPNEIEAIDFRKLKGHSQA